MEALIRFDSFHIEAKNPLILYATDSLPANDISVETFFHLVKAFLVLLFSLLSIILKGQCHEDFAVLGQFCAKIISLRL